MHYMLHYIPRRPGEVLQIGENTHLIVIDIKDNEVHLMISSPSQIAVVRGEMLEVN